MTKSQIITGDTLSVLGKMPDRCIDCCITSPPYFGLRDYGADGQIGLEETPEEYIRRLVEIFREIRRVMRDDGTLWLNIGDSYAGSGKGRMKDGSHSADRSKSSDYLCNVGGAITKSKTPGIKRKELIGIPWLLAFALRADGWYLRQDIIWYKPNTMPESVQDRCTKSHEYIFLLTKKPCYYFNNKAIQEDSVSYDRRQSGETQEAEKRQKQLPRYGGKKYTSTPDKFFRTKSGNAYDYRPKRNKRDVWSVSTHGYREAHFATFPEKLVEPCVLAGCRPGGIVLDPFCGSGTVPVVAKRYGREYIGIDINPEYTSMSERRVEAEKGENNK